MKCNVGIFLFPEIEVLDFAGPYEVFTTARQMEFEWMRDGVVTGNK